MSEPDLTPTGTWAQIILEARRVLSQPDLDPQVRALLQAAVDEAVAYAYETAVIIEAVTLPDEQFEAWMAARRAQ